MTKMVDILSKFQWGNAYTLIGNHELYNFPRNELLTRMPLFPTHPAYVNKNRPQSSAAISLSATADSKDLATAVSVSETAVDDGAYERGYFHFQPHPSVVCIVLDSFEISILGYPNDHPNYVAAEKILKRENKNDNWDSGAGMRGTKKRYCKFNGGVSVRQLDWLVTRLTECERLSQIVVVFSHTPLSPCCTENPTLSWDYDRIHKILASYKCVKACFSGHDHEYGHGDDCGIHHVTLQAPLLCPPDENAFGMVHVYPTKTVLEGIGMQPSKTMKHRT